MKNIAPVLLAFALSACAATHSPEPLPDSTPLEDGTLAAVSAVESALLAHGYTIPAECGVDSVRVAYVPEIEWSSWCGYEGDVYAETMYSDPMWGACSDGSLWIVIDWPHPFDRVLLNLHAALRHFVDCAGLEGDDLFYSGTSAAFRPDGSVESDALRRMTGCDAAWCL